MGKIYKERNEKDLPDNFLDIVNCVEIDTKYLKKHFDEEQKIKFNEVNWKFFFLDKKIL